MEKRQDLGPEAREALDRAYETAKNDLRRCYADEGILAGLIRFDDYWARDSLFASLGSLRIGDSAAVKKNFELLLRHEAGDGKLPRRVERYFVAMKYLKLPRFIVRRRKLRPRYTNSLGYCYSVDQNSLFIISLLEYIRMTKDTAFLKKNYEKVRRIIEWNFSNDRERDLLLEEGYFANWEDTIFWRGKLLYTNVLHYKALADFAELSKIMGEYEEYKKYLETARKVKDRINRYYWDDDHYIKSVLKIKKYMKYFCIDANMLAIIFGVADRDKAERIIAHVKELGLDKEMPLRSTWPRYPLWKISPTRLIIFSTGYHNTFGWIWVSCLYALALHKLGRKKEALDYMARIARKINEYGGVYEVYSKGRPVRGLFVKSDYPFAWSAGMFIYAYNLLKVH